MRQEKHRQIYEQHHGPIPRDETGRSYDIHHIDGDHSNNDPSNLKAVTVQEHYDIHWRQKDYGACRLIAFKIEKTPEELSEIARLSNLKRIAENKHNWQDKEAARQRNLKRIAENNHPFLNVEAQRSRGRKGGSRNKERVENSTHILLKVNAIISTCPCCGKTGKGPGMKRWHFDNCGTSVSF